MNLLPTPGKARARYDQLSLDRSPFIRAAEKNAKLTIPSLFPPEDTASGDVFYQPYQSVGARGINHLASKLVVALFPPNAPFFRMKLSAKLAMQLEAEGEDVKQAAEEGLAEYERQLNEAVESTGDRVVMNEIVKHLLVAGNILLQLEPDGAKVFTLHQYVVKRDPMGRPQEMVVKESFTLATLPEDVRIFLINQGAGGGDDDTTVVDIFTHLKRQDKRWEIYQESEGHVIPGSTGTYPLDKCPWIPLRMIKVAKEDYGRAYTTEYVGDLYTLETLSQAVVEASVGAAKMILLCRPNGTTNPKSLAEAPNGAVLSGDAADVTVVQLQKFADLRIARDTMSVIESRLQFAFLLQSAIQRSGERVTAEEIRVMAQELDEGLGGIYSLLAMELQIPYIQVRQAILTKRRELPPLPKGSAKFSIITGLAALGRGHDRTRLTNLIGVYQQLLGEQAMARIDYPGVMKQLATAEGVDAKGTIVDEEKFQQMQAQQQQQGQMQELMAKLGPEAMRQFGAAQQQGS